MSLFATPNGTIFFLFLKVSSSASPSSEQHVKIFVQFFFVIFLLNRV